MLVSITERRSPITNRKSVVYLLRCDTCGTEFEGCRVRYERSKLHLCNMKCQSRIRREHPELFHDSSGAMHTPEAVVRAEATRKRKIAEGTYVRGGHKHSEETKKRLSKVRTQRQLGVGEKNGMFGRRHCEETRAKMSDAKTRLILAGGFHAYGTCNKKGSYTSLKTGLTHFFRSSWEEAFMKWLDASQDVKTWEYESFRIPYEYDNHKRWYVPDFLVTRTDDSRQLIEIKPREFVDAERPRLKAAAAATWCAENGASYVVATKQTLAEWGVSI